APDACGAIEIEKSAAAGAGAVFDDEMAVEQDGFDLREERVIAIEVSPTSLRHADFGILEIRNGAADAIGFGDEVGVEDGDEFAVGSFQPIFVREGVEAFAVGAMNVADGNAMCVMALDAGAG